MNLQFEKFHPLVLFCYYAGAITLVLLLLHPFFLASSLVIAVLLNFVQDRCRSLRRWLFFIIITGLLIIVLNPLFNERGRHVLYQSEYVRITLESMIYGSITALSIICIFAFFSSYNDVMTPNKLMFLFSKIVPQFAVLLMLTLRFIPLMKRRLDEISLVQRSKGIYVSKGSFMHRAKNGMLYVQTLLTYSLEEAIQTADSMKARGYGQRKRTTYEFFRVKKADFISLVCLFVLFASLVIGRFFGFGHLIIYPILEQVTLTNTELFLFGSYMLFLGFPLLTELGGYIRWRILN